MTPTSNKNLDPKPVKLKKLYVILYKVDLKGALLNYNARNKTKNLKTNQQQMYYNKNYVKKLRKRN